MGASIHNISFSFQVHRFQAVGYSLAARIVRKRCYGYATTKGYLAGKTGLEFGGPSSIFSANHLIPLYGVAAVVDLCDFAQQTIWRPNQNHRRFGAKFGRLLIVEACDACGIGNGSYDFVAASHVLEHVANPLRVLQEWKRLLKPSGTILVVVPHKSGMFDHRRPFTTFDHIKADFAANITEADLTHLPEILELHDLDLDPPAGSAEQFGKRCLQNLWHRAMHHHVFSPELLVKMFSYLDMRVLNVAVERPYHTIVHAQKTDAMEAGTVQHENAAFLEAGTAWQKRNPFRSMEKDLYCAGSHD